MDVRDDRVGGGGCSAGGGGSGRVGIDVPGQQRGRATVVGAVEETGVDQAQALFDVNFFGAFRVAQAVLPTMRAQHEGRIIFVSSVVGFLPAPFMGFYAATKHAIGRNWQSRWITRCARLAPTRALGGAGLHEDAHRRQLRPRAASHIADYATARARAEANLATAVNAGEDPFARREGHS